METILYLHQQGIIHRDVKLENILVNNDGVALTDFGISFHREDQSLHQDRVGSPHYLTPEFFECHKDKYGFALDIWAAGCVLWLL